ncbi:hypothetical protein FOF52_18595 [Thermobifida alba]|uniref:Uncharacterized protein n=1 Tax=Thermobifida alba TaxID=53522 RepID=A0ABY4L5H3_THEAE|nr:hypothetical protein [Thermobifida alba]UPT22709.1 hypothetical protein FOF52_18595 [Thermobifida alba]
MEKQVPWHHDNAKVGPFTGLMAAAALAASFLVQKFSWYVSPVLLVAIAATLWGLYRISANAKAQKNS